MGELVAGPGGGRELPAAARLVNLTPHEVVIESQVPSGPDSQDGSQPSVVRLAPDGRFARVVDDGTPPDPQWLNSGDGLLPLTCLRRSRRLAGLPAASAGVRYVVPWLTALAAWHRADLVFPFGEVRDEAGRITRVRGLASFQRSWAAAERYRAWRAVARLHKARRDPDRVWLTGVLFAVATALLSGALGLLPGAADDWRQHGWAGGVQFWTSWLTLAFGMTGLAMLGWAAWRWRRRGLILDARGTAYVIEEQAIAWRLEEKSSVLAAIGDGFARVLRVPGPEALGAGWHWQAGADGATQWDRRADELVASFWAVHYNDDHVTRNAVFTWAPWPVAMAFGARATARRRGLVLHVRQRPSYGANGPRQELRLTDEAHDFLRDDRLPALERVAPDHKLLLTEGSLTLHVTSLSPAGERPGQASDRGPVRREEPGLLLLVVRLVDRPLGPIPLELDRAPRIAIEAALDLAGSVIPTGTHAVPVAEWRLAPAQGAAGGDLEVPWAAFPAAAEQIADWVTAQSRAHPGRVVLLATRIPQELAVGLGVQLGQRGPSWPEQLFPVYYAGNRLIVPSLRLGADSVPGERP